MRNEGRGASTLPMLRRGPVLSAAVLAALLVMALGSAPAPAAAAS
jgi:hypothetical protein